MTGDEQRTSGPTVGMATGLVPHGHERSDVSIPGLVAVGIGLVVVAIIVHVVLWLQLGHDWRERRATFPPASHVAAAPQAPPAPRLQTSARGDLEQLRGEEARILGSYGWVDQQRGIIRIPIERAIALEAGTAK